MIGIHKLDVETWNLGFPMVLSVRYYANMRHMSVFLNDHKRPVFRFMYYGPMDGMNSNGKELKQWLADWEPGGLNVTAMNDLGILLALLWYKRFGGSELPDLERAEEDGE